MVSSAPSVNIAPVEYDSAIVARLRDAHGQPRFPQTLQWLQRRQRADGTWGSDRWHAHDRTVSTLAALLCLHEAGCAPHVIERGLAALPALIARLNEDEQDTIGFEVIAPALLDRCKAAGLAVPTDVLVQERERGKARIAQGLKGTLAFSLEGLDVLPRASGQLIAASGSFQGSPSATAAYLMHYPDTPRSLNYLQEVVAIHNGGVPTVHPLQTFPAAWTCWHMDISGQGSLPQAQHDRAQAELSWTPQGAPCSDDLMVMDADDTAMSFLVQRTGGKDLDIAVFAPFIDSNGARCYVQEYDRSVSANVHVLLALRAAAPSAQRDAWIALVLRFLHEAIDQRSDNILADKWHISPTYTTSHAILATHGLDDALCDRLLDGMLASQNVDGSWGVAGGSAEEVAYCLHALCLTYKPHFLDALRTGYEALDRLQHRPHPSLWIGKSLYQPVTVITTAIDAAQHLAIPILDKHAKQYAI